nr:DUF4188 domain-containing protein [Pseudonocardia sp. ICBG601]
MAPGRDRDGRDAARAGTRARPRAARDPLGDRPRRSAARPVLARPRVPLRYASDTTATHRPAWAAFNRRARRYPGAVGIWHETFVAGEFETVYGDMPASGLAKALGVREVDAATDDGRRRLDASRHAT